MTQYDYLSQLHAGNSNNGLWTIHLDDIEHPFELGTNAYRQALQIQELAVAFLKLQPGDKLRFKKNMKKKFIYGHLELFNTMYNIAYKQIKGAEVEVLDSPIVRGVHLKDLPYWWSMDMFEPKSIKTATNGRD